MKVLGIDTSGYANAVGVINGDKVLADFVFEARRDSLEKIVANIDFALKEAGLTLDDIDGFGVGLGPGSWTGIKVGVTVGKILALSTKKPVAGVPTLEALAYAAGNIATPVCSVIDAGTRDTVYAALYRIKDDAVRRVSEYYIGDVPGLAEIVSAPVAFVGSGVNSYRQLLGQIFGSSPDNISMAEDVSRGAVVARLAAIRLERGESDDTLSLEPLYLKESTAKAFLNKYKGGSGQGLRL